MRLIYDLDEDWRTAQARYMKKHGGFGESDAGPRPQSQTEELTAAEQAELTEKLSRMSIERPFDSSEYLDGPRIRYDDGEPSPWGDDPLAPAPRNEPKPKAEPADGSWRGCAPVRLDRSMPRRRGACRADGLELTPRTRRDTGD